MWSKTKKLKKNNDNNKIRIINRFEKIDEQLRKRLQLSERDNNDNKK